jgi:hypothetical protein
VESRESRWVECNSQSTLGQTNMHGPVSVKRHELVSGCSFVGDVFEMNMADEDRRGRPVPFAGMAVMPAGTCDRNWDKQGAEDRPSSLSWFGFHVLTWLDRWFFPVLRVCESAVLAHARTRNQSDGFLYSSAEPPHSSVTRVTSRCSTS